MIMPARASAPPAMLARPDPIQGQLNKLVDRLNDKLEPLMKAGTQITEAALAPELKDIDALLAEHKSENTDAAAKILELKIEIYQSAIEDSDRAIALWTQMKTDFPATMAAKEADDQIKGIKADAEANKVSRSLKPGVAFPAFAVQDLSGQPLSIDSQKGKVTLIDFWATWCEPCMVEMPNVIAAYNKYHGKGFAIVGISLDDAKDTDATKLAIFLKGKSMPWPQYYDGKHWENKLAVQFGVHSIPANYLLDAKGQILGKDLRGEALDAAIAAALAKP